MGKDRTGGSWTYGKDGMVSTAMGTPICRAFGTDPATLERTARFIAAAPDMLAALEDIQPGYDIPWGTIRAAIAKATGGA